MNCTGAKLVPIDQDEEAMLSASDLCKILRACRETGVVELNYGQIRVQFGSPPVSAYGLTPPGSRHFSPEVRAEAASTALVQDELSLRSDQLAEALIADPVEYERLEAEGELENGPTNRERPESSLPGE